MSVVQEGTVTQPSLHKYLFYAWVKVLRAVKSQIGPPVLVKIEISPVVKGKL